jgi:transcriptional regulator with XRE-family HTH domain
MSKVNAKGRKTLKKFGLLLRQLRDKKGWTLEDAEEHGFSSWRYLQRLEAGKHNVSLLTIIEVARLYKRHPSELLKEL